MHGKNLLVDDSGDRKAVEAIGECFPQLDIVATLALVVEAIDSVDRGALVVTSEDEEVFGVLDLVGKEQANGLKRLLTSVDVVTEEEVVGLRREATVLEESEEIVVLSMDITADLLGHGQVSKRVFLIVQDPEQKRPYQAPTLRPRQHECWPKTYLDWSLEFEEDGLRDEDLTSLGAEITDLGLK